VKRAGGALALAMALVSCAPQSTVGAVATPTRSPSPTALPSTSPTASERQTWLRVRTVLPPGTPVAAPVWLPPTVDRSRVELREIITDPADPRYAVAYIAPGGATILFGLGPASADLSGRTGVGIRVRGAPAVLSFPLSAWNDRTAPALRRVRWEEGGRIMRIESDRFSSDDLLHVAWSLDETGRPAPTYSYTRAKPGACAGVSPEETVRNMVALSGARDRDAVFDCWALEMIGVSGPGIANWADLPRTSALRVDSVDELGGRREVTASWRFASDPGGPWGPMPTRIFLVGLDEGRWRVHEVWTAAIGALP